MAVIDYRNYQHVGWWWTNVGSIHSHLTPSSEQINSLFQLFHWIGGRSASVFQVSSCCLSVCRVVLCCVSGWTDDGVNGGDAETRKMEAGRRIVGRCHRSRCSNDRPKDDWGAAEKTTTTSSGPFSPRRLLLMPHRPVLLSEHRISSSTRHTNR